MEMFQVPKMEVLTYMDTAHVSLNPTPKWPYKVQETSILGTWNLWWKIHGNVSYIGIYVGPPSGMMQDKA